MKKILALLACLLCLTHAAAPLSLDELFADDDDDFFGELFDFNDDEDLMMPFDGEQPQPAPHSPVTKNTLPTDNVSEPLIPQAATTDEAFLKALPDDAKKVPPLYTRALRKHLSTLSEKLHTLGAHLASLALGAEYHNKLSEEAKTVAIIAAKAEQLIAQKVYHLALYHKDFNSLRRRIAQSFNEIDQGVDGFVDLNIPDTLEPLPGSALRAQKRVFKDTKEMVARVLTPLVDDMHKVFSHTRGTQRIKEKQVKYEAREQAVQKAARAGNSPHSWGGGGTSPSYYAGGSTPKSYERYAPSSYGATDFDAYDWGGADSYNPWDAGYDQSFGGPGGSSYYAPPQSGYGSSSGYDAEPISSAPIEEPSSPGAFFGGNEVTDKSDPREKLVKIAPKTEKMLIKHITAYQQHKTESARARLLTSLLADEDFTSDLHTIFSALQLTSDEAVAQTPKDSRAQQAAAKIRTALTNAAPLLVDSGMYIDEQPNNDDPEATATAQQIFESRTQIIKILSRIRKDDTTDMYEAVHTALQGRTETLLTSLEAVTEPQDGTFLSADETTGLLHASTQLHQQPALPFYSKTPDKKKVKALIARKKALDASLPEVIDKHVVLCRAGLNEAKEDDQATLAAQLEQLEGIAMIWRNETKPVQKVENTEEQLQTSENATPVTAPVKQEPAEIPTSLVLENEQSVVAPAA